MITPTKPEDLDDIDWRYYLLINTKRRDWGLPELSLEEWKVMSGWYDENSTD